MLDDAVMSALFCHLWIRQNKAMRLSQFLVYTKICQGVLDFDGVNKLAEVRWIDPEVGRQVFLRDNVQQMTTSRRE